MALRSFSVLLCILLIGLLFLPMAHASDTFSSLEEVQAFLSTCAERRLPDFSFSCSRELYEKLSADNFAALYVLQAKCGISETVLHYSEQTRTFLFSSSQYAFIPWAECADEKEVRLALMHFAEDRNEAFRLFLSPGLCQQFYENNRIYMIAAACGISECAVRYLVPSGIIHVQGAVYATIPYASASNAQEFVQAVEQFAQTGVSDFYICLSPEFYDSSIENTGSLNQLLLASPLDHYSYAKDSYRKVLSVSQATYSFEPRIQCLTESAVIEAIEHMGASGVSRFMLILDRALFAEVSDSNFQKLHHLETEAGLVSCTLSFNREDHLLLYEQAVIQSDVVKLGSIDEVNRYMALCADSGADEIHLFCTPEVYDLLLEGIRPASGLKDSSMSPVRDVAAQAGLFDYVTSYSPVTCVISFGNISYYPGTKILWAVRTGNTGLLTERERKTWQEARTLAENCKAGTPLETARNIHDSLAQRILYTLEPENQEGDTAIGAFLNHQADCDGYADAFYLTASLAGLNVRYQHGDSYRSLQDGDDLVHVTHMWNLLEIDGTWRLVDVTWDDTDQETVRYTFFNLGYDRACRMHIWNEALTVPLDPVTDLTTRPDNEYTLSDLLQPSQILDLAAALHQTRFDIIYPDPASAQTYADIFSLIRQRTSSSFSYTWNDHMLMLSIEDLSF